MNFLFILLILPFAISVICNIVVYHLTNHPTDTINVFGYHLTNRQMQNAVLVIMSIVIGGVGIWTNSETPKIVVVPDCIYKFADPAKDFSNDLGLKPIVTQGNYGPCGGQIINQSLPPNSEVHVGTKIYLTVSRGSAAGYVGFSAPCH